MALVLNIETATTNCSVSLSKDGETLLLKEDNTPGFSHAEKLHLFIDEIISNSEYKASDIDAIAVSKGPGSYTGLRIGVSSAKGLCYALNKPLIAIDTLESLAHQVSTNEGLIIPMLDARRMEVYAAIYNYNYESQREIKAEILTEDSYSELLETNKVYFVGSGVEKTKALINHPNAVFIEDKLPSANEMALLAEIKHKKSDTEDVAYFEPYYLKDFVALKKA
ncbi:tRNA (adenosine(37)-N6)-threonylcarbamoyltransferase complex dimerization subunit type 1 TsaB [Winogradskyella sp.]|nr:tRNA (adenosine(37)-N6)-threonylcarbamoyltransferase complex dimerization subunit type 1 TsaB [Winogradskyella sp.]MDB9782082.1 tRNA (adenosine(37)-N6)-threonylcarbamoyltransferase complex dimerization subunit type 1 TsaB [Winogradskyella sp.]MDC0007071.1 tRNA (adenosine(37)-N6)-threonylcarbamoyltransferase complex dimerization subunit type 1 TsaB [Winogradskyella sp.]MDC0009595.1 tRNA (adenosine(37)-N6)-threonylcarbamoyltransferase complex dimerization subunit type 1 TsaB [Winogradskyella sp